MTPIKKNVFAAWVSVLILCAFFFYASIAMNMFNTLEPFILKNFSAELLGTLSFSFYFSNALMLLPAGLLLDRMSAKTLVIYAMPLFILAMALFAMQLNTVSMCEAMIMAGCAGAFSVNSAIKYASEVLPENQLAFMTGLLVLVGSVGGLLAQRPLNHLLLVVGWDKTFVILCLLGLLLLLTVVRFTKQLPVHKKKNQFTWAHIRADLKAIVYNKQNWLIGLSASLLNSPIVVLAALWGNVYLVNTHGLSFSEASTASTMIFVGMLSGAPLSGYISDRLNTRKTLLVIGSVCLICISTFILFVSPDYSILLILFFVLGLFSSVQIVAYPLIKESNPPELTGLALTFISTAILCGAGILQLMFGKLVPINAGATHLTLQYEQAFAILPLGFLLSLLFVVFIKETHCPRSRGYA